MNLPQTFTTVVAFDEDGDTVLLGWDLAGRAWYALRSRERGKRSTWGPLPHTWERLPELDFPADANRP